MSAAPPEDRRGIGRRVGQHDEKGRPAAPAASGVGNLGCRAAVDEPAAGIDAWP
jgi:hypothetical protein